MHKFLTALIALGLLTTLAFAQEGPSLTVFDQTLSAGTITIDTIVAEEDGFIVVHAFDANGDVVLTPPLGLTYIEAGESRYVDVSLDADLLAQYGYTDAKNVLPMLHIDANDNQTYEFPSGPDVPVTVDGAPLTAVLQLAQPLGVTPSVTVDNSEALLLSGEGLSLRIPSATLPTPGFVVLHAADENGELIVLPVIGRSGPLSAGTTDLITVEIAEDAEVLIGDRVFAMLHYDDGDGEYTFPASDAPITLGGDIVLEPFTLD